MDLGAAGWSEAQVGQGKGPMGGCGQRRGHSRAFWAWIQQAGHSSTVGRPGETQRGLLGVWQWTFSKKVHSPSRGRSWAGAFSTLASPIVCHLGWTSEMA
jgi:hypothetical protein